MRKLLAAITVLAYSCVGSAGEREIPFFENKELTPYFAEQSEKYTPAKVEGFKAVQQNEKPLTQKNFEGHLSLINFFFVQCPGICPMMMKNVQRLQKAIGEEKDNVHIYSFSVQPEADTPERLRTYAENYKISLDNWTLLTGEKKEIYRVGKNMFKADGAVGDQKSDDSFIHTQNLYLVDQNLHIRGIYNTSDPGDMNQLKQDIVILNKKLTQDVASK